jgi:hypothetical protein
MKLIIAGSRTIKIETATLIGIMKMFNLDLCSEEGHEVVAGGCPTGADAAAKSIPKYITATYKEFSADWEKHGKAAGPIRNKEMAKYSDALLLIWDGESCGSLSMKKEMQKLNKPVFEVVLINHGRQ